MITAIRITSIEEIEKIVRYTFSGDDVLFQKYHLINTDREKAIQDTLHKISGEIKNTAKYLFFVLQDSKGIDVGYFCGMVYGFADGYPMTSLLHSFGLNVTFRTKENIRLLFELAKTMLGGESMLCSLYEKNTRAINSCKLSGFEVVTSGIDGNEPYVILKLEKKHASNDSNCSSGTCIGCGRCESAV